MGRPAACGLRIGVYGPKTRALQRSLSFEVFGLTFKVANVYRYLGDRSNMSPDIDDVHSVVFNEVPDRAYDVNPVEIPIGMERLSEGKMDFSRFGVLMPMQEENLFRVHIDDFDALGRELITGDVFEMPFYAKDGKKSYWEITDVDLKLEAEKFIAIVYAAPLGTSRVTREIPVDNSNDDLLMDIMLDNDDELANSVKSEEPQFADIPTPEAVDYRFPDHASFLDDPDKEF